jgi:hypothetical protein
MDQPTDVYQLFPMLLSFEAAVKDDPDALGVLYTGSLGRGTCDRFSDLDIKVWVSDEAPVGPERLRQLLGWLGEVHYFCSGDDKSVTGGVGPEWRRTDLDLLRREDLKPGPYFADARVVKDTDGVLARLLAESPPEVIQATLEQAREMIQGQVDSQIYLALHNARGAVWSAMGEVSYQCACLYTLLARLRGRNSYGLRYVEALLSPEEQALLTDVWPTAPTQQEVRRTGLALWTWTRYVWAEAERELGRPLGIAVDEVGLLAAVDRIYTRCDEGRPT